MKIVKTKNLVIVQAEEKEKKQKEHAIEGMQNDLAAMVFESMQDKMKITQLEGELGNAMFEIMNTKMGGM